LPIKDKVVSFYVKNFLIPRAQCFDKPGFVYFNMSGKTPVFSRQVIMPETFLMLLEKNMAERYGDDGRRALYSAGKKFGYRFAIMGGFSTKKELPKNTFLDNFEAVNKFIEGTYASEITQKPDLDNNVVEYQLKNFVVCSSLGHGYFLPLGAAAGLISRMFEASNVEGIHLMCQGKGDAFCKIVYAPKEYLEKKYKNYKFFLETDLSGLELEPEYISLNRIQEIKNSTQSFKSFLDGHFFNYKEGIITRNDQRYFILEVSAIYLLERELEKNKETEKLLFDCAFETGQLMLKNIGLEFNLESITGLLTAFGLGDVLILKKEKKYVINIDFFPYSKFFKDVNFTFFNGILSGMISMVEKEKVTFSKVDSTTLNGRLNLSFFQS